MIRKHIFFIHGRSFKPTKTKLRTLWYQALSHGLKRDLTPRQLDQYKRARKTFIHYGDLSNSFLKRIGKTYSERPDIEDRKQTIDYLKAYTAVEFHGPKGKHHYNSLAGKDANKELLADIFATPLDFLHLSEALITRVAPDMRAYWDADDALGSEIRWRLTEPLTRALSRNEDILLLSHSLGSLVAYDVLWKFSHYAEYKHIRDKKLNTWITLGSPLGNETVKKNLKGSAAQNNRRFPHNINHWINIAAEDDYISHDQNLLDDFRDMKKSNLIQSITDHRIYNLAIRNGRSNPHNSAGYLIHPRTIGVIAKWL